MVLIAEDVLLLLLDDDSGTVKMTSYPQAVVGGAILTELVLDGYVILGERPSFWHRAKLATTSVAPPTDPVLLQAYNHVARYQPPASDTVTLFGKRALPKLAQRLVDQGVLSEVHDKTLGIFPRTRWPEADATRERRLRDDLAAVLVGGIAPTQRLAAVAALVSAAGIVTKVVDWADVISKSELQHRAREIAEGDWAAGAVKDAIAAASAAIISATTAATAAAVIAST